MINLALMGLSPSSHDPLCNGNIGNICLHCAIHLFRTEMRSIEGFGNEKRKEGCSFPAAKISRLTRADLSSVHVSNKEIQLFFFFFLTPTALEVLTRALIYILL